MSGYTRQLPRINYHASIVVRNCEQEEERPPRLLLQQIEALHNVKEASQNFGPRHIALVSMPTGSGKTGVIACLPYYLAEGEHRYIFDKPILVIAPNLDILEQLRQQLTVEAGHQNTFLIRRGIVPLHMQDDILPQPRIIRETSEIQNEELLRSAGIVIANAQKFLADDWEAHLRDDLFRLVIVDEAHHHPAPTWKRIVEKFRSGDCPVIFFTATPYRTDGAAVLPAEISVIAHHLPLETAVNRGIIRETKFEEVTELWPVEQIPDVNFTEVKIKEIQRIIPILNKIKSHLDIKRDNFRDAPHMAIVITKDTKHADDVLKLWLHYYPNEPAETYHSKKTEEQKKKVMERLRNNELRLVLVVAMLLEGFDHPPISIAGITCKIGSPVRFVQFVGRAQRVFRREGYTEDPNFLANIFTHKGYEQQENYNNFIGEKLIPIIAENVD